MKNAPATLVKATKTAFATIKKAAKEFGADALLTVVKDAEKTLNTALLEPLKRGRPAKSHRGRPRKVVTEIEPTPAPKKRGRPKGSKNAPKAVEPIPAPKKRGRPKGSKNAPKTAEPIPAPKKRGRPKGSKNTPKTA